ncbi:MAG: beta-mannosidase [Rhizobiaceae bacterium]|nr:beta-mannosidase [Rhizobiaceae bacterium]
MRIHRTYRTHTVGIGVALTALLMASQAVFAEPAAKGPRLDRTTTSGVGPVFGAYDPSGAFGNDKQVGIEHLFLPWEDVDLTTLKDAEAYAKERGRSLIITVEPWTWSKEWRTSAKQLKDGVISGAHDENMAAICRIVGTFDIPVTIRWGHEMEDKSGQFTWANWKPEDYIQAYRHVVDVCRKEAPNAKFMWSPLGEKGLEAYYPGDKYVDTVGLSVFGLQKYDRDETGKDRSFAELLDPKYARVARFRKPVVVAEYGCSGDEQYVEKCFEGSKRADQNAPDLKAVVYFNDKEVYPWPNNYGLPDWRVKKDLIN